MQGYAAFLNRSTLENIVKSGIAELSNNLCEQKMKPIKLNLINSQTIGSEDAARRHCVAYSLVESAACSV